MSDTRRYLRNILWSWLGAASIIVSGIIVSPFVIRRLGSAEFGIWSLALSLVEYLWLIDLGLRPATVKLTAEYHALSKDTELAAMINTAATYSAAAGLLLLLLVWPNADRIAAFFRITHPAFPLLVRLVGISWSLGVVFNIYSAVIEGLQRFDLINRVSITATLLRSTAILALVAGGFGLREMGVAMLASQLFAYALIYAGCRRVAPRWRPSLRFFDRTQARELWLLGRQAFAAMLATRISQSSAPSLVAYFLPVRYVTYYSVTQRLVDYLGDLIGRIGLVTGPRVADWMARGRRQDVILTAGQGNRYCLCLWGYFAGLLAVYGDQICRVWINEELGREAGALLPVLLAGYTLIQGQFVSGAVLMGIGKFERYAGSLFVEALLMVAGLAWVLPRYGLLGAFAVISTLVALNRAAFLSWIFARQMEIGLAEYLLFIYPRPLSLILASVAALALCKQYFMAGRSWWELILVAGAFACLYAAASLWLIVSPDHRRRLILKVKRWNRIG